MRTSRKVRPPIGKSGGAAERRDHRIGEGGIVLRKHPEGIAHHIVDAGALEVELDVPGLLGGAGLVEPGARQEGGGRRIVARAAGRHGCGAATAGAASATTAAAGTLGGRGRRAQLRVKRLEHAGGLLAARHAQVQPLLGLARYGLGIVLAIVAALPAVLLRHGGHQAPAQRPALRRASCARRAAGSDRARAPRRRRRRRADPSAVPPRPPSGRPTPPARAA